MLAARGEVNADRENVRESVRFSERERLLNCRLSVIGVCNKVENVQSLQSKERIKENIYFYYYF